MTSLDPEFSATLTLVKETARAERLSKALSRHCRDAERTETKLRTDLQASRDKNKRLRQQVGDLYLKSHGLEHDVIMYKTIAKMANETTEGLRQKLMVLRGDLETKIGELKERLSAYEGVDE